MLKLYAIPVSLYCAKLRIVLRHKELEWEEIPPPGGYGSDEYKRIVPAGNLPALDHDGFLLSDSEAIAEYLNERFPDPPMLPGDTVERAKIRERSRFHDTRLEPVVRSLFAHIAPNRRSDAAVSDQWKLLNERLRQLVPLLPDELEVLTLADCGYPITCTWIKELTDHFNMPSILTADMAAYLDKATQHKAVSTELAEYQPRLADWLSSQ